MPRKTLAEFSVEWLQVLDENGKVDSKLMPKLSDADLLKMYEYMVTTRVFDDKLFKLQRQGRMGTIAQSLGQEAAQIGSAFALADDDMAFPAFREHGVFLVKKFPMKQYMQYWSGDERGSRIPEGLNIFAPAIPVGSQIPHAVGYAWAMKLQKKKTAATVYFGDGATSRGDFHEGMNFAGTFKLPCIFICQNNQWAISVPVSKQTASETLAQKAVAYGFRGIRVDGNDVLAVYAATKEALDNARNGGGPTLIECFTYRISDHTTSDDARRYRSAAEVEEWKKKDPLKRMELYLMSKKLLTEDKKNQLYVLASEKVESAVKEFETIQPPAPEEMFGNVYSKMTAEMTEQMEEVKQNAKFAKETEPKKDEHDVGVAQ